MAEDNACYCCPLNKVLCLTILVLATAPPFEECQRLHEKLVIAESANVLYRTKCRTKTVIYGKYSTKSFARICEFTIFATCFDRDTILFAQILSRIGTSKEKQLSESNQRWSCV